MIICAVLICDLSGFTTLCECDGIQAGLAEVRRFRALGQHYVQEHGGRLVKFWADNFAATFPTVRQAVDCAHAVIAAIPSSAGIGYGDILLEDGDLWGVEVNAASRLGEDVAGVGEVLLTETAQRFLGLPRPTQAALSTTTSGPRGNVFR